MPQDLESEQRPRGTVSQSRDGGTLKHASRVQKCSKALRVQAEPWAWRHSRAGAESESLPAGSSPSSASSGPAGPGSALPPPGEGGDTSPLLRYLLNQSLSESSFLKDASGGKATTVATGMTGDTLPRRFLEHTWDC